MKTTTTTDISTTTTERTPIEPVIQFKNFDDFISFQSDVFILVITKKMGFSYLESGDGSSQISTTINAPQDDYASYAAYALVNGKLHLFGGYNDNGGYKVV